MAIQSLYDLVEAQPYVDGEKFGDKLNPARVTILGSTPGLIQAKVYALGPIDEDHPDQGYRWIEADQITEAKVSEQGEEIVIEGTSAYLQRAGGLSPEDAGIRYAILPKDCENCG